MYAYIHIYYFKVSQMVKVVKNLPAKAGDASDVGSVPEAGRSSGEGNGNQLQCFLPGRFQGQRSHVIPKSWT